MLSIETNHGNFSKVKDIYTFMKEENLNQIEFKKVEYCLNEIIGKGTYTLEEIKEILQDI